MNYLVLLKISKLNPFERFRQVLLTNSHYLCVLEGTQLKNNKKFLHLKVIIWMSIVNNWV
jgi:hypothetical protein